MEITGKIIAVLPLATGTSRTGNQWKSQSYVLETQEAYPRKVCFELFGDKADQFPCAIDEVVTVSFDIESREWNGRWFTSIRAWKIEKNVQPATEAAGASLPPVGNLETFDASAAPAEDDGSGLPF